MKKTPTKILITLAFLFLGHSIISAQGSVEGEWLVCSPELDSIYFKFDNGNFLFQEDPLDEYTLFSTYTTSNDTIFWNDLLSDDGCQPSITGVYVYTVLNDSLTFDLVEDACEERAETLFELLLKRSLLSNLNNLISQKIIAYPNPVRDYLTIKNNSNLNFEYRLYDLRGRLLLQGLNQSNNTIHLESIQQGTYILSILNLEERELGIIKNIKVVKI